MMFPGEVEAVKHVLAYAEQYGYGNLIAHLRRAWALRLMEKVPGLTFDRAAEATMTDPYPPQWDIDAMAAYKPPRS